MEASFDLNYRQPDRGEDAVGRERSGGHCSSRMENAIVCLRGTRKDSRKAAERGLERSGKLEATLRRIYCARRRATNEGRRRWTERSRGAAEGKGYVLLV